MLTLIISFAAGLTVGLQLNLIVRSVVRAINQLRNAIASEKKKNSGVVRPGLIVKDYKQSDEPHKSAVVRPRMPVEDSDDTNVALQSVRSRVAGK